MNEHWKQITLDRLRADNPIIQTPEMTYGGFEGSIFVFEKRLLQALAKAFPGYFPERTTTILMDIIIGLNRIKQDQHGKFDAYIKPIVTELLLIKQEYDWMKLKPEVLQNSSGMIRSADANAYVYSGVAIEKSRVIDQLVINDSGIYLIWAWPKMLVKQISKEGYLYIPEDPTKTVFDIRSILTMYATLLRMRFNIPSDIEIHQLVLSADPEMQNNCPDITLTELDEIHNAINSDVCLIDAAEKERIRIAIESRCRLWLMAVNTRRFERLIGKVSDLVGKLRE